MRINIKIKQGMNKRLFIQALKWILPFQDKNLPVLSQFFRLEGSTSYNGAVTWVQQTSFLWYETLRGAFSAFVSEELNPCLVKTM